MIISIRGGLNIQIDPEDLPCLETQYPWWVEKRNGYVISDLYNPKSEQIKTRIYLSHKILKCDKGQQIIYKNGDRLDLRKENLLVLDKKQNAQRQRKTKKKTTSKYKGVTIRKSKNYKKWIAQIMHNRQHFYIGIYDTEEKAALAYNEKAKELFGDNSVLNIIN